MEKGYFMYPLSIRERVAGGRVRGIFTSYQWRK
jgi:hypothetical protein